MQPSSKLISLICKYPSDRKRFRPGRNGGWVINAIISEKLSQPHFSDDRKIKNQVNSAVLVV